MDNNYDDNNAKKKVYIILSSFLAGIMILSVASFFALPKLNLRNDNVMQTNEEKKETKEVTKLAAEDKPNYSKLKFALENNRFIVSSFNDDGILTGPFIINFTSKEDLLTEENKGYFNNYFNLLDDCERVDDSLTKCTYVTIKNAFDNLYELEITDDEIKSYLNQYYLPEEDVYAFSIGDIIMDKILSFNNNNENIEIVTENHNILLINSNGLFKLLKVDNK